MGYFACLQLKQTAGSLISEDIFTNERMQSRSISVSEGMLVITVSSKMDTNRIKRS